MTLPLLIVALWLLASLALVGWCRAAAQGDCALFGPSSEQSGAADLHDGPLAG